MMMTASLYTIEHTLLALFFACLLVLLASILRYCVPLLKKMHLPAAVIGGLLGLALGPQLLGAYWADKLGLEQSIKEIYTIWKQLPGFLISLVFAELLMGKRLPSMKKIWDESASQVIVGYSMAWGQYIVGLLVAMFLLVPFFDANILSASLIVIGFQGGYGTAAGLGDTYGQLGFEEGYDLAIAMATAGKVAAILVGLILINIAVTYRKMKSPDESRHEHLRERVSASEGKKAVKKQREEMHFSADRFILHLSLLCVAICIGWCIREVLFMLESVFVNHSREGIMQYIPLFPMAMIGGALLQWIITYFDAEDIVNARHLHSMSHSFLDLLIVVAIATISLETLSANWVMVVLMVVVGVGWNLFIFFLIAPYFYESDPWIRGIGDFAHSTGATTTGLMLMKLIDPNDKTGVKSSFSLKQSFYEPIVGGGFITALALPLIHALGAWQALVLMIILLLLTLLLGWKSIGIHPHNKLFR
ncbi:MAG: sodium:glutamate symporter [Sphaerospermopsis sp. SIO1G2]|nr:sodium:glutamate symporter [Sphaerospermopsis sp. SIO1G2]